MEIENGSAYLTDPEAEATGYPNTVDVNAIDADELLTNLGARIDYMKILGGGFKALRDSGDYIGAEERRVVVMTALTGLLREESLIMGVVNQKMSYDIDQMLGDL